jgi:hypothetical protein
VARGNPAAAKGLHVHEIAAVQDKIGLIGCSLGDDRRKPRDIAGMRAQVQVRQKCDAQRAACARPSFDR